MRPRHVLAASTAILVAACGVSGKRYPRASTVHASGQEAHELTEAGGEVEVAAIAPADLDAYVAAIDTSYPEVPVAALTDPLSGSVTVGTPGATLPAGPGTVTVHPGTLTVEGAVCAADGTSSASGSVSVDIPISASLPDTYIGSAGLREHEVFIRGHGAGTLGIKLSGSIAATASSWTARISAAGRGDAIATIFAKQKLHRLRRVTEHEMGNATIVAAATFSDSVTYTQSCAPAAVMATTEGGRRLAVAAGIVDASFSGFFFPALQGPAITAVRNLVTNWAVRWANRKMPSWIESAIGPAMGTYDAKKRELLNKLVGALPPGCGCNVLPVIAAVTNPPATTTTPTLSTTTTTTTKVPCGCTEQSGQCYLSKGTQLIPVGAPSPSCAQQCVNQAAQHGCLY